MIHLVLFSLLIGQPAPTDVPDELPGVTVIGHAFDYRLGVNLTGAEGPADLIVSQAPAMTCGDPRFDRTPGPSRQCWLRVAHDVPVVLTAQRSGTFGRDWTIDWSGCVPQGDGRSCVVSIDRSTDVGAIFRTL